MTAGPCISACAQPRGCRLGTVASPRVTVNQYRGNTMTVALAAGAQPTPSFDPTSPTPSRPSKQNSLVNHPQPPQDSASAPIHGHGEHTRPLCDAARVWVVEVAAGWLDELTCGEVIGWPTRDTT
jgi:hypothetical protein